PAGEISLHPHSCQSPRGDPGEQTRFARASSRGFSTRSPTTRAGVLRGKREQAPGTGTRKNETGTGNENRKRQRKGREPYRPPALHLSYPAPPPAAQTAGGGASAAGLLLRYPVSRVLRERRAVLVPRQDVP